MYCCTARPRRRVVGHVDTDTEEDLAVEAAHLRQRARFLVNADYVVAVIGTL